MMVIIAEQRVSLKETKTEETCKTQKGVAHA